MARDHLEALRLARDGNWDAAHRLAQRDSDRLSCLIHGYLHRVEGDLSNANYWYKRADESMPDNTLDQEWKRLYEAAKAG